MNEEKQNVELKVQESKTVIINNQSDYLNAVEMLKGIKALRKKLDDRYKPIQEKTKEANQLALQNIRDYQVPLNDAERTINSSMGKYVTKKNKERKAEEDRIKKIAEEKERADIKKDLEECGLDKKEAEQEAEKMEVVVPDVQIQDETKVENLSYRTNWYFLIEDVSKIPREYMIPDEKRIGNVARTLKGTITIPGVKIYSEKRPILR